MKVFQNLHVIEQLQCVRKTRVSYFPQLPRNGSPLHQSWLTSIGIQCYVVTNIPALNPAANEGKLKERPIYTTNR